MEKTAKLTTSFVLHFLSSQQISRFSELKICCFFSKICWPLLFLQKVHSSLFFKFNFFKASFLSIVFERAFFLFLCIWRQNFLLVTILSFCDWFVEYCSNMHMHTRKIVQKMLGAMRNIFYNTRDLFTLYLNF